jgi:Holliday junction resolvase RusA-like endonuclease
MRVRFTVLGHPITKGDLNAKYFPKSGKVGLFWPARVKKYQKEVEAAARDEMQRSGYPIIGGRVTVHCTFHIKPTTTGRLRGDIDKLLRTVYDAMTGIVYEDDELVVGGGQTKVALREGEVEHTEVSVAVAE